ncbi:hypothetical protein WN943_024559 [Citrus x changshan-huyou]
MTKNIVVDAIPFTTIYATTSDVAACSEETLVERGIIPSILFSEKEASVMASNNSPNATFKDDAKAKERAALDKANAEMDKTNEQIESILHQGYEDYLKGLKDCRMFFACYNADADIEVIDQHLKELSVKFDENKPNEDNGSKTCIDGGCTNGTRDTHLTEKISTVIPEGFEALFRRHPDQWNDDFQHTRNF